VFFVDTGIDSGPILVQKRIIINTNMSQSQLIKLSKRIGMDVIIEAIELIKNGDFKLLPNPEVEMTYFSFPTREDVKVFYNSGKRFY
jgi:methionyl-tRNA formyltransferase